MFVKSFARPASTRLLLRTSNSNIIHSSRLLLSLSALAACKSSSILPMQHQNYYQHHRSLSSFFSRYTESTTPKKCKEHIIQRGVIRADYHHHHHHPIDKIDIVSRSYHNITTSSSYIISNVMYDASSYAYNTTLKSILLPLLTTIQRIVNAILATLLLLSCIQAICCIVSV